MPGHFTFFTTDIRNDRAFFGESEYGHAIRTLRYREGDAIEFTDGRGTLFFATIAETGKNVFVADISGKREGEPRPALTVCTGMIKSSDRMEWMVEKCTELGVAALYFVKTRKSERDRLNSEKLQKTAIAALKQCHRTWLPQTGEISWADILKMLGGRYIAAIPRNSKPQPYIPLKSPHTLLVGPEGDFTSEELEAAIKSGFIPVTLGSAVLRTETAVVAAVAHCALSLSGS